MAESGQADLALVAWARTTARELLADLGRRWAHVEAVGHRAEEVASLLDGHDRAPLVAGAYLHDLGYAAALHVTGLHQVDGARWLRNYGVDQRVCNLVAHHSGARFEAEERGLLAELNAFGLEMGPAMDGLVFADMTTTADGTYVTFDQRMDDILRRYPPDDPVHRAMVRARPVLRESVERTLQKLAASGQPM